MKTPIDHTSSAFQRIIAYMNQRLANLERKLCHAERQATLLKLEMEGYIPHLHVMLGNGVTEIYFATGTYSGGLNWHVLTPSFPRPFAPLDMWTTLNEMLNKAKKSPPPLCSHLLGQNINQS